MLPLRTDTLARLAERLPVPAYDRSRVRAGIVHIGVGGFHRAHQAVYLDQLMRQGQALEWGVCGVGVLPSDRRMQQAMQAQDCLYTVVVKHADGSHEPRVVGSMVRYLFAPDDPEAVVAALADEATRIVTLTITEGGYDLGPALKAPPEPGAPDPLPAFGLVVEALARRRARGLAAFAVASCDNMPGNGDVARQAFATYAGLRDPELGEWVRQEVPFPSSMVDRITPQTTDEDREQLAQRFEVEDRWPVFTEAFTQWVLEDAFPLGRPPLEDVGVQLVADVVPYELMKLRLLNASHQVLGYLAHLMGHRFVHEACRDPLLARLLTDYMAREAAPTLPPVPGVDLQAYQRQLLGRFSNAAVRDTVARLCAEGTDRIATFVLPVVRDNLASGGEIERAATAVAAWARYGEGVDEQGEPFEVVDRLRQPLDPDLVRRDPLAPLRTEVFGDLVHEPRFARAFTVALASLHQHGARATVKTLLRS